MIPSATSLQDYDFGIMSDYVRPPEIKKKKKKNYGDNNLAFNA